MKKSKIGTILLIIFIINLTNLSYSYVNAQNYLDTLKIANDYMEDIFGRKNYFEEKNRKNRTINKEFAEKGYKLFGDKPILVYGTVEDGKYEATKYGADTAQDRNGYPRALGFSMSDDPYANPGFVTTTTKSVKRWIKFPWVLPDAKDKGITKELSPDDPNDKRKTQWLDYKPDTFSTTYSVMKQWISDSDFTPDNIKQKTGERDYFIKYIYDDLPPGIKNNPEDYIYIIQPPTYDSWGVGIAFYYYGDGELINNYMYYDFFRFIPASMVENDISASFESLQSSVVEGEEVLISVNIKSTFNTDLKDVSYKWEITNEDGTPLSSECNLQFPGKAEGRGDEVDIPVKKGALLYASLKMPNNNVKVKFEINSDGKNPEEKNLLNNVLETTINKVKTNKISAEMELDYNILSRNVNFPLTTAVAQLSLPKGSWDGNATGSLGVNNTSPNLIRNFKVNNNPAVNEASTTITRSPDIDATFKRPDFGDDPLNGKYINGPTSIVKSGNINFGGSVSRPYMWIEKCGGCRTSSYTTTGADGKTETHYYSYCDGHEKRSSVSADFNSGTNTIKVSALTYNGKKTIAAKQYDNKIQGNTKDYLEKVLYWTSEPYLFKVIRWMCHQDVDNSLYDWTPVPGQYERTFTQQCSGNVKWSTVRTMKQDYSASREAARQRKSTKSSNDRAVFASDVDYKYVDYPIKSGYYFNPTGEYTFTVKTVTYKTTTADTKDHKDLVNSVINSFRYETDLMYIDNNKKVVNIQNQPLSKSGNSYLRKSAALTAQDNTGVNNIVLLNVLDRNDNEWRYSKDVEEIEHTEDRSDSKGTHVFWKNILEGYSESGTSDSQDKYKYREYVKDGQHIYKITEETVVTIQINPENKKLYTYAHMPNGKYTVKAWIDDISLPNNEYKKLGTLKGISSLDEIEVSVKGSIYDDIY
ncbi:hypothetical protein EHE19_004980 [Ruminiclostridium herbifermentans]|uniref:Uncharacterized protein n=1 Tax=Ruminiclostridium herbifermentans TaxID=2488810 RepID=A0A4U7JCE9_9FIRM|nr:hypothetical protein [Ruminiclostridium herbifermentans]QNU67817.1 hypothetical protein EHE19_004980 [Ruminiclostridium herbifermentans]